MKLKDFYKEIKKLGKEDTFTLKIKWIKKEVKAMAEYITKSGLQYIKIVFTDKSFLYVPKNEEELYFSENYSIDTGVDDKDIGVKEIIKYNDVNYYLENKDDYQFVKRLYVWGIQDIEGEVRFSDYIPKNGDDILSLWWTSVDNKRCDLNPVSLDMKEVNINKNK